jgi:hypothetical protein
MLAGLSGTRRAPPKCGLTSNRRDAPSGTGLSIAAELEVVKQVELASAARVTAIACHLAFGSVIRSFPFLSSTTRFRATGRRQPAHQRLERLAASELEVIAHDHGTPALRAAASCARGAVAAFIERLRWHKRGASRRARLEGSWPLRDRPVPFCASSLPSTAATRRSQREPCARPGRAGWSVAVLELGAQG